MPPPACTHRALRSPRRPPPSPPFDRRRTAAARCETGGSRPRSSVHWATIRPKRRLRAAGTCREDRREQTHRKRKQTHRKRKQTHRKRKQTHRKRKQTHRAARARRRPAEPATAELSWHRPRAGLRPELAGPGVADGGGAAYRKAERLAIAGPRRD